MDLNLLVDRAKLESLVGAQVNGDQLRVSAGMSFQCSGTLTSLILGVAVWRESVIRNSLPEVQLWSRENDTFTKMESRQISFTPEDFNTDGVYRYNIVPPIEFDVGDIIGIYQPQLSRSSVIFYYIPSTVPQLTFLASGNSVDTVNLNSFVLMNESLLMHPITSKS